MMGHEGSDSDAVDAHQRAPPPCPELAGGELSLPLQAGSRAVALSWLRGEPRRRQPMPAPPERMRDSSAAAPIPQAGHGVRVVRGWVSHQPAKPAAAAPPPE